MKRQMIVKHVLLIGMFALPVASYGAAAYIPQTLKQCMAIVREIADSADYKKNFEELNLVIAENRMLVSDEVARQSVVEALSIIKKNRNRFENSDDLKSVKRYLKKYLNSLSDRAVLLVAQGDESSAMSWPTSLVRRSVLNENAVDSASFDLMRLSSELVSSDNITLCGDMSDVFATQQKSISNVYKNIRPNLLQDPGIVFNANMMSSITSVTSSVVFGTGVSSPVINAWTMSPSGSMQYPVNIQFAVPADLIAQRPISLELHFLTRKQGGVSGNIRIEIKAEYIDQSDNLNIFEVNPSFSDTTCSLNFNVSEPSDFENVRHVFVTIPLENSSISAQDFALLSLQRIEPTSGNEYSKDIYLAAAIFRYTNK